MLSDTSIDTIEVETGERPEQSIIWLHGLGADGNDFVPIVPELRMRRASRFIFPHAPQRAITINAGMQMRAWFDILSLSRSGPEDDKAIHDSAGLVTGLIDREIERGIASERIVLAGFSQGGAMALHKGLRHSQPLAGIIAMSAFLPLATRLAEEKSAANANIPIFMAHGTADPVIELAFAELGRDALIAAGYKPSWHTYAMAHSVCAEEVADISGWLAAL